MQFKKYYLNHTSRPEWAQSKLSEWWSFSIYLLWAVLESTSSWSSICACRICVAQFCKYLQMLPGTACGIYFNITEIKIILFWNICRTPWFHTGVSHSSLSIPKLNTSHKTKLRESELGHAFFIVLIRILINIFGDIHIDQSSGAGESQQAQRVLLHHTVLKAPVQQGMGSNQQGFRKLENERTDLILVQNASETCKLHLIHVLAVRQWTSNKLLHRHQSQGF